MNVDGASGTGGNERIAALERQVQRLRGMVLLLILMAAVQIVWHLMPGPDAVSARRFVLKQRGAPPRGEFSLWDDGTPAFRINNERGEALALWALRKDGRLSLRMSDAEHTNRIEMGVDPEGTPYLTLSGNDGRSRARLGVDAQNHASLDYPQR